MSGTSSRPALPGAGLNITARDRSCDRGPTSSRSRCRRVEAVAPLHRAGHLEGAALGVGLVDDRVDRGVVSLGIGVAATSAVACRWTRRR